MKYNDLNFQKQKCYKLIYKLPAKDKQLVLKALKAAEKWHKVQTRLDINYTPYIIHIYRVITIMINELKIKDPEVLAAGALHDVIEDSEVTEKELEKKFGKKVAEMVKAESQNLFPNRINYMSHFKSVPNSIKQIKVSDRLDNLRSVSDKTRWPQQKKVLYAIESEKYILPISKNVSHAVYRKLEKLILKFKTKDEYASLYKRFISEGRTSAYDGKENEW